MKPGWVAVIAGVAAAFWCPAIAAGATISYEGTAPGTLVYTGQGTEANNLIISSPYNAPDTLEFYDYGASITYPPDRCFYDPNVSYYLRCQMPVALRFEGGDGNDFASLNDSFPATLPVTLRGDNGDDKLTDKQFATAASRFEGGPGNDTIDAHDGNDVVLGGDGNDKLAAGRGADEVRGGDGNDDLKGDADAQASADVIDGGPGFDSITDWSDPAASSHPRPTVIQNGAPDDGRPGEGDNVTSMEAITVYVPGTYEGTPADDAITVHANLSSGSSVIRGLEGNDRLEGGDKAEDIDGGPGDDTIRGGYYNDTIRGGPGRDTIEGDGGAYCDYFTCTVPAGNDTIDVRDGEVDSVECGPGTDTVVADAGDTLSNCENVDRGTSGGGTGGGGTGGGTTGGGTTGGGTAGSGSTITTGFTVLGRPTLRSLLRSGLAVKIACPRACTARATLLLRRVRLGSARRTLLAAGEAQLRIRPGRRAKRVLRRLRRATLRLTVTIQDSEGTTTSTRTLRLAR